MKIKTGDMVKVISGRYKGTTGEVKAVSPKTNKVIVEGVNLVKKSMKPTQANPEGGIAVSSSAQRSTIRARKSASTRRPEKRSRRLRSNESSVTEI